MVWPLITAAAAPVIGGLIGSMTGKSDRSDAETFNKAGLDYIQGLSTDVGYRNVDDLMAAYDPNLPESEVGKLQFDQESLDNMRSALNKFKGLSETGSDAISRLQYANAINNANRQNIAAQNALLQNAAATGTLGAGANLAAQLSAQQNASNQAAQNSMQVAANAEEARRNALSQFSNLSSQLGQMRNQFNTTTSEARDLTNRYANQNSFNKLQAQQNVNMANANAYNQNQMNQANLRYQKAGMMGGQYNQMANNSLNNAQSKANMWGGIGQGIGQGFGAYGNYMQNQEFNKQNTGFQNNFMNMMGAANNLSQNANGQWVKNS